MNINNSSILYTFWEHTSSETVSSFHGFCGLHFLCKLLFFLNQLCFPPRFIPNWRLLSVFIPEPILSQHWLYQALPSCRVLDVSLLGLTHKTLLCFLFVLHLGFPSVCSPSLTAKAQGTAGRCSFLVRSSWEKSFETRALKSNIPFVGWSSTSWWAEWEDDFTLCLSLGASPFWPCQIWKPQVLCIFSWAFSFYHGQKSETLGLGRNVNSWKQFYLGRCC